jgi:hypothetical protein
VIRLVVIQINPNEIDVHRPLKISLYSPPAKRPKIVTVPSFSPPAERPIMD